MNPEPPMPFTIAMIFTVLLVGSFLLIAYLGPDYRPRNIITGKMTEQEQTEIATQMSNIIVYGTLGMIVVALVSAVGEVLLQRRRTRDKEVSLE